jgi:hypothetical protein
MSLAQAQLAFEPTIAFPLPRGAALGEPAVPLPAFINPSCGAVPIDIVDKRKRRPDRRRLSRGPKIL